MRDEQTGTYWQQITGMAVSGPLQGRRLSLVAADELSFKLWKAEQPDGTVLQDVPGMERDYSRPDWDQRMARAPVVISYAQAGIKARDVMLGVSAFGQDRAFPYTTVLKEKVIEDRVGTEPVLIVLGPDDRSVRAFRRQLPSAPSDPQFYRLNDGSGLLMDNVTGSRWNFQGCAVTGKWKGVCLEQLYTMKDYWFDWRNYHPNTSVYGIRHKIE